MNDFGGMPKSTYYYRKKHPKKLTLAEIAKKYGVTRQCIYSFSKRRGIKDLTVLENEYRLNREKRKESVKRRFAKIYADFEILESESCSKGFIRLEKQSRKDKRNNLIRLVKEAEK